MCFSTKGTYIFPFDFFCDHICLEMEMDNVECVMSCVCYETALEIIVGDALMSA